MKPSRKARKNKTAPRPRPNRPNPLKADISIAEHLTDIASNFALQHATRGMSGSEKAVLCAVIETVFRPLLGKITEKCLRDSIEQYEADRIEGEYEKWR